MCIVTYIPTKKGFFFTSNRDEVKTRQTDCLKTYKHQGFEFLYPKDLEKGGSWFVVNTSSKKIACLLNATGKQPNLDTKMSRGLIPINFLIHEKNFLLEEMIEKVSPFTLICIQYGNNIIIEEFEWNGERLTRKKINEKETHLWCSNTLYNRDYKEHLTKKILCETPKLKSTREVIDFHKKMAQPENSNVYLKKDKCLQTLSITCFNETENQEIISYLDIQKNATKVYIKEF